jgi:chromosome segregation ATPase
MISIQEEYEKAASAKIAKRDQQLKVFDDKLQNAARVNEELEERAKKIERSKRELMTDNDRLRRQLGSRFGPSSESEKQLEELISVCNSLREENRRLKGNNPECGLLSLITMPEICDDNDSSLSQHIAGISKAAFMQLREGYEEKIEALETEKRDLIMRNSAAVAETQKAEKRSWELEEEITKIRSELTTAKLVLQRTQRRDEFPSGLSACSRTNYEGSGALNKENNTNSTTTIHSPEPSLSNYKNWDFIPKPIQHNSTEKADLPCLMELTSKSGEIDADGAPECKQS